MADEPPGLLATAIAAALRDLPELRVEVTATDSWDTRSYAEVRTDCHSRGISWFPVRTELAQVVIGPLETPGTPGCVECADMRRGRARTEPRGHESIMERHGSTLSTLPSIWLTSLAADLVGELVAEQVRRPDTARIRNALLYIDLDTLSIHRHSFLPDPRCPVCGDLPDDSPAQASIVLEPRKKPGPDVYRVGSMENQPDDLITTYVDAETGLIRGLTIGEGAGVVTASAPMGLRGMAVERGFGRTRSYRISRTIAILEALERHGGMEPGGKRTVVEASYEEVAPQAIDPRTLGLHPAARYGEPGFRFQPFDTSRSYRWVWAYSFALQQPILVPESYAYYRTGSGDAFVYEISNGCALGSCIEEAILYGILEVAERDAFLMTWYASMPVTRIDLDSATDRTITLMGEAIRAETGYTATVFDTTLEQGIPCVWALAVQDVHNEQRPMAVCAAGSHLDPQRAVENALSELGPIIGDIDRRYPHVRERARQMTQDPALVASMPDHSIVYGHPAAFPRLDFLTGSTATRRISDMAQPFGHSHDDLSQDLRELIRRYLDSGLDVIVVDQTTPEHQAGGFNCVKVIIPGTLPMTFGHSHRRVDSLPRLRTIPHVLGHLDRPLSPEAINPHPHPFP